MDAVVKPWPKGSNPGEKSLTDHVHSAPPGAAQRPSREEAEAAVRTLIAYIGDDPATAPLLIDCTSISRPCVSVMPRTVMS